MNTEPNIKAMFTSLFITRWVICCLPPTTISLLLRRRRCHNSRLKASPGSALETRAGACPDMIAGTAYPLAPNRSYAQPCEHHRLRAGANRRNLGLNVRHRSHGCIDLARACAYVEPKLLAPGVLRRLTVRPGLNLHGRKMGEPIHCGAT